MHVGQVLAYNDVDVNVGNGYPSNDGIFTAPVSGVYVFTATIVSNVAEWTGLELVVNGIGKGTITSGDGDFHQTSSTIIAQVFAGQHVYTRVITMSGCNLISHIGHGTSSFSGWHLFEL